MDGMVVYEFGYDDGEGHQTWRFASSYDKALRLGEETAPTYNLALDSRHKDDSGKFYIMEIPVDSYIDFNELHVDYYYLGKGLLN